MDRQYLQIVTRAFLDNCAQKTEKNVQQMNEWSLLHLERCIGYMVYTISSIYRTHVLMGSDHWVALSVSLYETFL